MHQIMTVDMEKDLLEANRALARENNGLLKDKGIRSVDFLGSVGSGKTLLIQRLSERLMDRGMRVGAVTGDVSGDDDMRRLSAIGIPVANVNTGKECHLDAHLAEHALEDLPLDDLDVVFFENVGNLVCPADFPIGADRRVVVISVTEGDDMIRKHPMIFMESDVIVINKTDLAPVMEVDLALLQGDAGRVRPDAPCILTDAKRGGGIDDLMEALGLQG
ncbi:MAG: hydrogenase nickel incorporation protein HypB [Candidatus Thermoplasmatota archaeon]|nr:hydrogenase nickel incorporation protein HypB [Candidatus Thermoplasmatota archaeon]